MKVLDKGDILALAKPKAGYPPVAVEVPEWDGTVFVRRLSVAELAGYEKAISGPGDKRLATLAFALCDDAGTRHFADHNASELAEVESAPAGRIVAAFKAANHVV